MTESSPLRTNVTSTTAKRVVDVAVASSALAALAFPLFAVALAIKLDSPGPVFYRGERIGRGGRIFRIFKFRSMRVHDGTGPATTSESDPRVTRMGHFIRRYKLDEFAQLINVLLGDMSLVGPRPERPPFVRQFRERIPEYMRRHRVKSGMTGWAQVNGWRGNTSIEKRIEYDLYYIENWSLLLDLKILILTLLRGFGQRHAY